MTEKTKPYRRPAASEIKKAIFDNTKEIQAIVLANNPLARILSERKPNDQ